jgi:hypothetical protein
LVRPKEIEELTSPLFFCGSVGTSQEHTFASFASISTNFQCNPSIYAYHKWQHKSKYDVLIRELDGEQSGELTLPSIPADDRYQDSGEYIMSQKRIDRSVNVLVYSLYNCISCTYIICINGGDFI